MKMCDEQHSVINLKRALCAFIWVSAEFTWERRTLLRKNTWLPCQKYMQLKACYNTVPPIHFCIPICASHVQAQFFAHSRVFVPCHLGWHTHAAFGEHSKSINGLNIGWWETRRRKENDDAKGKRWRSCYRLYISCCFAFQPTFYLQASSHLA